MSRILGLAFAGTCALLSGCAATGQVAQMNRAANERQAAVAGRQQAFADALSDRQSRIAAQEVAAPWVAGTPQPLARDVSLPPALRENVPTTLMLSDDADLYGLAQRLGAATGIPVRVQPEALLPLEQFLPRLAVTGGMSQPAPLRMEVRDGPLPLADLLDALAARFSVHWRYVRNALEFYRTETRVFDVRALSLASAVDVRLGRSGSDGGEGFESTSNTTLSAKEHHALAVLRASIVPFLTRSGLIADAVNGASSIIVTDTPEALERVALYLERENKAMTRRVRLVFEEITVIVKQSAAGGLDWNALYAAAGSSARYAAPAAAALGASTLEATLGRGALQGSQAVISALSAMGAIVRHNKVPVLTLNRRPVTHAIRTTFSYIDRVQSTTVPGTTAAGANGSLPAVSITQKEETVGSFLTLVPDIQPDGQILLSVAYDNAVAQPLKTITFGERGNQVQVQQITIDGNGTVQQIELRPGQPVILSGFDRSTDQHSGQRLAPGMPLITGGQDSAEQERETTLMLVTAQVEEGY
ncbi:type II secretion system protein GspD [Achromobacter piechaudii]|uniref:type II secretion system protein GspD n=1 Tax=Achromobacter piechaudii TaxID=72556 RepID=UPI003DA90B24